MRTSEQLDLFAAALLVAQKAISAVTKDKVGTIEGRDGKQGYQYKYSDLANVISHVKGPLNDAGIVFLQAPAKAEGGVIVNTRLLHTSGQWVECETFISVAAGAKAQAYGSAISYAKRYGLQSMSGLPSFDDDDGKGAGEKGSATNVNREAYEAMSEADQTYIRGEAEAITDYFKNPSKGVAPGAYYLEKNYDDDEKLALWFILEAPVRRVIKRYKAPDASPTV